MPDMEFITPVLNGFPLQGLEPDGTEWSANVLDGWWEPVESTGETTQNVGADGGWINEADLMSRTLVAGGLIIATSRQAARQAWDRFLAVIPVKSLAPFAVLEDGLVRHCMVRQEHKPTMKWESDRIIRYSVQLTAPDDRKLSGDGATGYTHSETVGLPSTVGGAETPLRPPFSVSAVVTSGGVTVTNAGNGKPKVRATLAGPLTNPELSTKDGQRMRFNLTVDAGQTLVIDLDKKTARLNGAVSRRSRMAGDWITPASDMELKFNADAHNYDALMTVQWADSWR